MAPTTALESKNTVPGHVKASSLVATATALSSLLLPGSSARVVTATPELPIAERVGRNPSGSFPGEWSSRDETIDAPALRIPFKPVATEGKPAQDLKIPDESLFAWCSRNILGLCSLAIASYSLWRIRYRTKDDFRTKSANLRDMFGWDQAFKTEHIEFVVAYDREPVGPEEKRLLVVETISPPKNLDAELDSLFGPYIMEHIRKAADLCTADDPFILDHIHQVPISWVWIRDEFLRWEFSNAIRLLKAKFSGAQRHTAQRVNLKLKHAMQSSLGGEVVDLVEGRKRDPHHYHVALLCQVTPSDDNPKALNRRIIVRVVASAQLPLFREPKIVCRMKEDNVDKTEEIRLLQLLSEREARNGHGANNQPLLKQGHPRRDKPANGGYTISVRLIHKDPSGTPVDAVRIRAAYGSGCSERGTPDPFTSSSTAVATAK